MDMDHQTSARTPDQNLLKQSGKKKRNPQQVKVVHFSNPVRVTTTAADFRALVQELTGRDSHIADLLAGHPPATGASGYSPLDMIAVGGGGGGGGGLDKAAIFDLPPPDFSGGAFEEMYGRISAEDFGGVLTEAAAAFEAPAIAGEGFCGWVL